MKVLNFNKLQYEAECIVKTNDSITGYNGDVVVFKFSGVSDFSAFTLADEQEFDVPEPTESEKLIEQLVEKDAQILKLKEEQYKTQQMTIQNAETQQELIELLMMIGVL